MMISVLMMCSGSMIIAILPIYTAIGTFAPLLLLAARLFQGLSVGGEYGASATYMSEVAIGGRLLAVLVLVGLQAVLTNDQLYAWGWRVPFLIGAIAAVVALFLRRSLTETTTAETRGRKEAGSLIAFGVLALACTRPLLMAIGAVTSPTTALGRIVAALMIVSLYSKISGLVKADLLPTEVRAVGVGLSFAIAIVLFGGTAEYVALWFKSVGSEGAFARCVTALCAVDLGAAISRPNMGARGYLDGAGTIETLRQRALK